MERCFKIGLVTEQLKEVLAKGVFLDFIEELETFENTLSYEDSVVYCIQRLFLNLKEAKSMMMYTNYCLEFEEEELIMLEQIFSKYHLDYQLFMECETQTETIYYLNRKIGTDSRVIECDQYAIPLNDYEILMSILNHKDYSSEEKLNLMKKEIAFNSTFENEFSYRQLTNVN